MIEKIATLWPEIVMLIGAFVCMGIGLAPSYIARKASVWVAGVTLMLAGVVTAAMIASSEPGTSMFAPFVKLAVAIIGLLLLMVVAGVPDRLRMTIEAESAEKAGKTFEPGDVMRGEFYAFFLFSLTGVMLSSEAGDLVWLFLSLELTSLPTYVMVATSRDKSLAQESAVKYFFLGAMAAAVFLYGFTLIYGATGFTDFDQIRAFVSEQGELSPLFIAGLVLSIIGLAFKIAAVPMQFYAADVYQGAHVGVTAFLAFVPKTAGFIAIILVLGLISPVNTPVEVTWLMWIMAALTMTVGNTLGLLQKNVKRMLAYSSIAHSGYMLVALVGGLSLVTESRIGGGAAAVLFYLVVYGLATLATFAVLGCLQRAGEDAETFDDISGLAKRRPGLAAIMLLGVLSLIGLPPFAGFLGKFYLLTSAYDANFGGEWIVWLIVIAVLNSAIAAVYYLRIAAACFFGDSSGEIESAGASARATGAAIAAIAAVVLGLAGGPIINAAKTAAGSKSPTVQTKLDTHDTSVRGLTSVDQNKKVGVQSTNE